MRAWIFVALLWPLEVIPSPACVEYMKDLNSLVAFFERNTDFSTFSSNSAEYAVLEESVNRNRLRVVEENRANVRGRVFLLRTLEASKTAWDHTTMSFRLSIPANEAMLEVLFSEMKLAPIILTPGLENEFKSDLESMKQVSEKARASVTALTNSVFQANTKARISFETMMYFAACEQE